MSKLLERFAAKPTIDNAWRVARYESQHPMSTCLLSATDREIYSRVVAMIGAAYR